MDRNPDAARNWPGRVTRASNVLDLEYGVFTWKNPKRMVPSLKQSAEASQRRLSAP